MLRRSQRLAVAADAVRAYGRVKDVLNAYCKLGCGLGAYGVPMHNGLMARQTHQRRFRTRGRIRRTWS